MQRGGPEESDRRNPRERTPCEIVPSILARLLYCFHSGTANPVFRELQETLVRDGDLSSMCHFRMAKSGSISHFDERIALVTGQQKMEDSNSA
jgi:hypothetical protein